MVLKLKYHAYQILFNLLVSLGLFSLVATFLLHVLFLSFLLLNIVYGTFEDSSRAWWKTFVTSILQIVQESKKKFSSYLEKIE